MFCFPVLYPRVNKIQWEIGKSCVSETPEKMLNFELDAVRCFAFKSNMQKEATIYMVFTWESNLLNYFFFHHVQQST